MRSFGLVREPVKTLETFDYPKANRVSIRKAISVKVTLAEDALIFISPKKMSTQFQELFARDKSIGVFPGKFVVNPSKTMPDFWYYNCPGH